MKKLMIALLAVSCFMIVGCDLQGDKGESGVMGLTGPSGVQGIMGDRGADGAGIKLTYEDVLSEPDANGKIRLLALPPPPFRIRLVTYLPWHQFFIPSRVMP